MNSLRAFSGGDQQAAPFELQPRRLLKWMELANVYQDESQPTVRASASNERENSENTQ